MTPVDAHDEPECVLYGDDDHRVLAAAAPLRLVLGSDPWA
jgi:hypothetical protein